MKGNKIGANLEINKDDNIHKSKALNSNSRTNEYVIVSNFIKQIKIKVSLKLCTYKLVAKVRNYRILFKDLLTFVKLNYRDYSHRILYLVIL